MQSGVLRLLRTKRRLRPAGVIASLVPLLLLAGCTGNFTLMIDSLAIMLAIVVPTILATISRGQGQAAGGTGRLARLEVALHLSGTGRRKHQRTGSPGRPAAAFHFDFIVGDERFLRAPARQHDQHHERHGHQLLQAFAKVVLPQVQKSDSSNPAKRVARCFVDKSRAGF